MENTLFTMFCPFCCTAVAPVTSTSSELLRPRPSRVMSQSGRYCVPVMVPTVPTSSITKSLPGTAVAVSTTVALGGVAERWR